MRSADEIRAEIERLRVARQAADERGLWGDAAVAQAAVATLQWVLADEKDKPKETGK